ncbi:MAG: sulfatase-like hydrolase/transferase [Candidatus Natronoplasma sp.]
MKELIEQKELVNDLDWKYLIVLDACRFDHFKEYCSFDGSLKKVRSPAFEGEGAPTSVWYRNVFRNRYEDIVHISSHPRVNSMMEVEGFKGAEHFSRVIDLWDSGWDERYGTVLPETVTEEGLKTIKKYPKKKFIFHYMQPHTPYLSLDPPSTKKKREPGSRTSFKRKARNLVVKNTRRFIGDKNAVDLMSWLGLPPLSPMDDALRKVGEDGVRKAYKENLVRALRSVEDLLDQLEGKVVITSDHGELLGERGRFGHDFKGFEELEMVPWFELEED